MDGTTIAIGCWRGRTNISVMVTTIECQEMLERLSVRFETGNGSKLLETKQSSFEPVELKANVTETMEDAETIELATVS